MELIIHILMLFIVIDTALKLSLWRWWQMALFALICSGFVVVMCEYAVLQSRTQLADLLTNRVIMQDVAVLITMESVLLLTFCFAAIRAIDSRQRKTWLKVLDYYPSLLIFPVLFYLLTQSIYAAPGWNFATISYILAAMVLAGIPLLSYAVRHLVPEKELRLEVLFLVSLFVCIIGLIATVDSEITYAAAKEPLNMRHIATSVCLLLIMFLSGAVWNKLKWKIKKY